MESVLTHRFLQFLINENIFDQEGLLAAITEAQRQDISFISYLLRKEATLCLSQQLAVEFCLPFIDLDTIEPLGLPIHLIDKKLLKKYCVLPLWQKDEKLGLAMADPAQQVIIDDIQFHTQLTVEKILVDAKKLRYVLDQLFKESVYKNKVPTELIAEAGQHKLTFSLVELEESNLHRENADNEMVIIHYVYKLLQSAIERDVSDIHIEPYQDKLQIRFRIDGLLYLAVSLPIDWAQRITTRLKIMSQLDIAERRIPQDGRFQIADTKNRNIDCRISSCPTLYGEKLVIRVLDSKNMLLSIDKLGMNKIQTTCFLEALHYPHGMILVTGPTGSGKTITLYTALNFLNTSILNISSVENPVEIVLPGINQVNINPKVGLDFSNVLRAFLRQDPDVIMVGEMRDQETAEIGIKAAHTGHLVLSSLHTNSAVESLVRLANMGIPPYNIASSVSLIIAQRLARCLCSYCKVKENLPETILSELNVSMQEKRTVNFFSARGCKECTEGYRGRTGIFEVLPLTDEIRHLILRGDDAREIALHAQNAGMQTLYTSALEKLKQGEISLLEMKRIIKD